MNLGAYYTPPYLVDYAYKLLKKHVGIENYTLLDTACGNKEFLKPPKQKPQISLVFGMNALVLLGTI
ncbi:hypothetical protein [Helicobacter pylori]|uniref:hypothetical protein n=1 Tax=Helicobacter pylori TaxID=210 RepID=UPI0012E7178D|nr:hypothetical protein [Helicobacter pylori]MUU45209.1 hypothetical protein [Helicobacter pylori]